MIEVKSIKNGKILWGKINDEIKKGGVYCFWVLSWFLLRRRLGFPLPQVVREVFLTRISLMLLLRKE